MFVIFVTGDHDSMVSDDDDDGTSEVDSSDDDISEESSESLSTPPYTIREERVQDNNRDSTRHLD